MGGSTYVHYIMCISVNLIDMLISMVIICNSPLFQHIQGDLKQICLYSGYEYLMASGRGGYLERNVFLWTWILYIKKIVHRDMCIVLKSMNPEVIYHFNFTFYMFINNFNWKNVANITGFAHNGRWGHSNKFYAFLQTDILATRVAQFALNFWFSKVQCKKLTWSTPCFLPFISLMGPQISCQNTKLSPSLRRTFCHVNRCYIEL